MQDQPGLNPFPAAIRHTTVELDFAQIIFLAPNIAEVIVDEGVEINLSMTKIYHHTLEQHLTAPFGVLVNKQHSYTYTFEAQQELGKAKGLAAIAGVAYSNAAKIGFESLELMRPEWNLYVTDSREDGLEWLKRVLA